LPYLNLKVSTLMTLAHQCEYGEMVLLLLLHSYNFGSNKVWPSRKTLASQMRTSESNLTRLIKRLNKSGWIRTEQRYHKPNIQHLIKPIKEE
jgi:DNA-binding MarR family transcriptional regulator